ncbi:MAG: DnaJ family molecular chaperone [Hyphomicrobium sp.]|nr:DnaJ family molecular chaperone [Hyphomicrobium sp.]
MIDRTLGQGLGSERRPETTGLVARVAHWLRQFWPRRRPGIATGAFTSAFTALAAKMAAADGVAVRVEAEAFEAFLEVEPAQCRDIRHVYEVAKEDVTGFEVYADRVATLLSDDPETKTRVLECLIYIACADGVLHPAEDGFLKKVACRFGFSDVDYQVLRARFVHDPDSPFTILGLPPDASPREVKAQWRRLVRDNHPDRLIAAGAPPAVVKAAGAKTAAINAAYKSIVVRSGG